MPKNEVIINPGRLAQSQVRQPDAMRLGGMVAGTRLLTPDGYRPIETLRVGDPVRAVLGHGPTFVPVLWIGRRNVISGQTERSNRPVRIRKNTVADQVPTRDVVMAPDQALYIDGTLIRCGDLVNGASIRIDERVRARHNEYWGVLLARHNILLTDGLTVESLLPVSATAFNDIGGEPPDLDALFLASRDDRERVAPTAADIPSLVRVTDEGRFAMVTQDDEERDGLPSRSCPTAPEDTPRMGVPFSTLFR